MLPLLAVFACDTGPNYGPFTSLIRAHRESLLTSPCDTRVATELAVALRDAAVPDEALQVYRDFEASCPSDATLLTAHLELALKRELTDEALQAAMALRDLAPTTASTTPRSPT